MNRLEVVHAELIEAAQTIAAEPGLWQIPDYAGSIAEYDIAQGAYRGALGHIGIKGFSYGREGQVYSLDLFSTAYKNFLDENGAHYPVPEEQAAPMQQYASSSVEIGRSGEVRVSSHYQRLDYHPDARASSDWVVVEDSFEPDGTISRNYVRQVSSRSPLPLETFSPSMLSVVTEKLGVAVEAAQAFSEGRAKYEMTEERKAAFAKWLNDRRIAQEIARRPKDNRTPEEIYGYDPDRG